MAYKTRYAVRNKYGIRLTYRYHTQTEAEEALRDLLRTGMCYIGSIEGAHVYRTSQRVWGH